MAEDIKYKYEVAFSFLQADEPIAYQINDLIQDRIETFLYSKKQEELGGTDGEKKFNEVFYKEENVITVTPWPFKHDRFIVFYEYKIIEQLKFTSIEEFDQVCNATIPQRQEFV